MKFKFGEIWPARHPFWEFYFGLPSNPELRLKFGYAVDSKHIS